MPKDISTSFPKPIFTIIVPCGGGNLFLKYLLQSLMEQRVLPADFELILAETNTSDHERNAKRSASDILSLFKIPFDAFVIKVEMPIDFKGHTAGPLRNAAVEKARGEYLIFIDSDIILDKNCLQIISQQTLNHNKDCAFYGLVSELSALHWSQLKNGYYISFEELRVLCRPDHREKKIPNPQLLPIKDNDWTFWYTCLCSVSKQIFVQAGGFDVNGYRAHDIDLAYRLKLSNCVFLQADGAMGIHLEHQRSISSIKEQSKGFFNLAYKYPELTAYFNDLVILNARRFSRLLTICKDRFDNLTKNKPGFGTENSWFFPLGYSFEEALSNVDNLPCIVSEKKELQYIYIRFDRNCWDYHFILPNIKPSADPLISVIVPTYNSSSSIFRCLTSIYRQTLQNFEIILIDDNSTDSTIRIASTFSIDKRMRIISLNKNKGLSYLLNKGLELACSEFIVQLDSDDWLESNALEKIREAFEKDDKIAAIYSDPIEHVNGIKNLYDGFQVSNATDFFQYPFQQVCRSYRKKVLLREGGWSINDSYAGRYYEDRLMLAKLVEKNKVLHLPEKLYNVDLKVESLSRSSPLEAAGAKLSILYDQAVKRNKTLSYKFEHNILKVNFHERTRYKPINGWTVIIPFYNWKELLYRTIQSWLESDLPTTNAEIIIVNDNSVDDIEEYKKLDGRIRIINLDKSYGPAYARNIAASAAKYDMLLFSDADHIISPDTICGHELKHHSHPDSCAVVACIFGRRIFTTVYKDILPERRVKLLELAYFDSNFEKIASQVCTGEQFDTFGKPVNIWESCCKGYNFSEAWLSNNGKILSRYGTNLDQYLFSWAFLSSGHFSISASVFSQMNGFDTTLKSFEDIEFGIRLQQSKIDIVCAPEIEPFHQVHPVNGQRAEDNVNAIKIIAENYPEVVEFIVKNPDNLIPPPIRGSIINSLNFKPISESSNIDDASKTLVKNIAAITFDDGPHPYGTLQFLKILAKFKVTSTFFIVGSEAEKYPEILLKIHNSGHTIGVHAWTHSDFCKMTSQEALDSLTKCVDLIKQLTGKAPVFARPPYGRYSPSYSSACSALSLTVVGWDISADDWLFTSTREIISRLSLQHPGGKTYLFHDGVGDPEKSSKALSWILKFCQQEHIQCTDLSEISKVSKLPFLKLKL